MIKGVVVLYFMVGILSYWPLVFHYKIDEPGKWYEWLCAWAIWSVCWPYRYIMDAWYWCRAGK